MAERKRAVVSRKFILNEVNDIFDHEMDKILDDVEFSYLHSSLNKITENNTKYRN